MRGGVVVCELTENGVNIAEAYLASTSEPLFYPEQVIEPGEMQGYPIYYTSQQSFYVQRAADTDILNDTMANVTEEVSTSKPLSCVVETQACIAQYSEDNAWYRAMVVSCDGDVVKVYFVDYGNSGEADKDKLLEISEALAQVPPLALPCRLSTPVEELDLMNWAGEGMRCRHTDHCMMSSVIYYINGSLFMVTVEDSYSVIE